MTSIVLVDKNGTVKQTKVKDLSYDKLHTKCGFKNTKDFDKKTTWNVVIEDEVFIIELWAKDNGRANTENKYDFPPPIDSELYFGTCCLVRVNDDNNFINLKNEMWEKVYEHLFGGFEDLDSDEEPSEDELEKIPDDMKTKSGYLKDGFVVSTDSDKESNGEDYNVNSNDSDENDSDESDSDEEPLENDELEYEIYDYSDDELQENKTN